MLEVPESMERKEFVISVSLENGEATLENKLEISDRSRRRSSIQPYTPK